MTEINQQARGAQDLDIILARRIDEALEKMRLEYGEIMDQLTVYIDSRIDSALDKLKDELYQHIEEVLHNDIELIKNSVSERLKNMESLIDDRLSAAADDIKIGENIKTSLGEYIDNHLAKRGQ